MLSNVQWLLVIILLLATFFVVFGCDLKCKGVDYNKKEGWTDQVRDHVSNPYFGDIFSDCESSLSVPREVSVCHGQFGATDRSLPLSARAQQLAYYEQGQQDLAAMQALQGGQM